MFLTRWLIIIISIKVFVFPHISAGIWPVNNLLSYYFFSYFIPIGVVVLTVSGYNTGRLNCTVCLELAHEPFKINFSLGIVWWLKVSFYQYMENTWQWKYFRGAILRWKHWKCHQTIVDYDFLHKLANWYPDRHWWRKNILFRIFLFIILTVDFAYWSCFVYPSTQVKVELSTS